MKKLLILLSFLFCLNASAEINVIDELKKLPAVNNGVVYSLADSTFDYVSSVSVVSFLNEKIKVDAGWTPRQKLLALASFKLVSVKDYISFPILDQVSIEPLIYVGYDRVDFGGEKARQANNEFDYGAGVKILSLSF